MVAGRVGRSISPEQIAKDVEGADQLGEETLRLLAAIAQNASELADGMATLLVWPADTVHFELNGLAKTTAFKPVGKAARLARLEPDLDDEKLENLLWRTFQYGAGEPGLNEVWRGR